jgi:hypothetical protein
MRRRNQMLGPTGHVFHRDYRKPDPGDHQDRLHATMAAAVGQMIQALKSMTTRRNEEESNSLHP